MSYVRCLRGLGSRVEYPLDTVMNLDPVDGLPVEVVLDLERLRAERPHGAWYHPELYWAQVTLGLVLTATSVVILVRLSGAWEWPRQLTFLSVLALYLFGGPVLNAFSFALVVGIIVGTYSTIFIASAIAIILSGRKAASTGRGAGPAACAAAAADGTAPVRPRRGRRAGR